MTVCHLGNIAHWLGRSIKWDPRKQEIIGDVEAGGGWTAPSAARGGCICRGVHSRMSRPAAVPTADARDLTVGILTDHGSNPFCERR